MVRLLFLIHRYLGIALGVLMVVWCLSGIVMMYVPYPSLERDMRFAGLAPLGAVPCCTMEGQYFPDDDAAIRSFQIEVQDGAALLTATNEGGRSYIMDISAGGS